MFLLANPVTTAMLPLLYTYLAKLTQEFEETEDEATALQLLTSISICLIADVILKIPYYFSENPSVKKVLSYINPLVFTGMLALAC